MTSQSFTLRFSPSLKTLLYSKFRGDPLPSFSTPFLKNPCSSFDRFSLKRKTLGFNEKISGFEGKFGIFNASKKEGYLEELDDAPLTVELQQICSESQFDRVIAEAEQLEESLIILWYVYFWVVYSMISLVWFVLIWYVFVYFLCLLNLRKWVNFGKKMSTLKSLCRESDFFNHFLFSFNIFVHMEIRWALSYSFLIP